MLGELGSLGYESVNTVADTPKMFNRTAAPVFTAAAVTEPEPVKVRAVSFQYTGPDLPSQVFMAASPQDVKITHPVNGKMYSADTAMLWETKAVKGGKQMLTAAADESPSFEMYPGMSVILDLDPSGPPSIVKLDGEFPVFAAWFDAYNQLLGAGIISQNKELPTETASIIITGFDSSVLKIPYAYGWHVSSQLVLINPNALTGIGAVILPDGPIRIKTGRTSGSYGLISGQKMVDANMVSIDGKNVSAGIKTILPSNLKTLAVLVYKDNRDEAFDSQWLSTKIKIATENGPEYRELTAVTIIDGLYETAVLYDLPADTGYDYKVIYTKIVRNSRISGVMALTEELAYVAESWQKIVLQPPVPYPYVVPEQGTIVTIEKTALS